MYFKAPVLHIGYMEVCIYVHYICIYIHTFHGSCSGLVQHLSRAPLLQDTCVFHPAYIQVHHAYILPPIYFSSFGDEKLPFGYQHSFSAVQLGESLWLMQATF